MANLDTRNKRSSAMSLPWMLVLPLADGTVDQPDRQQSVGDYCCISAGVAVPVIVAAPVEKRVHRIGASLPAYRLRERILKEDQELLELIAIFVRVI